MLLRSGHIVGDPKIKERVIVMSTLSFTPDEPEFMCATCKWGPLLTGQHCPRGHVSDKNPAFKGSMDKRWLNRNAGRPMQYSSEWKQVTTTSTM